MDEALRGRGKTRCDGYQPGDGHHLQRVHACLRIVGLLLDQAWINYIHYAFHSDAGFCNVGSNNDPPAVWRPRGKNTCLDYTHMLSHMISSCDYGVHESDLAAQYSMLTL